MKDKQLNELFISLVKEKIKDDKKLVSVLSDILNLQKEAIYRRLRNEVVFTFSEIVSICCSLSISLEQILDFEKLCYPYQLYGVNPDGLKKNRTANVKRYVDIVSNIVENDGCEYAEVTASIPVVFTMNSDYLLKWYLFIWDYHRYYNVDNSFKKFHEFTYEPKMTEFSKITSANLKKFTNTYYIINRKFLEDLTDDIKTLINLKSIREEDIDSLKKELTHFLDYLERIVISGCYPETGKKVSVYISDFRIRSGFAYIKSSTLDASILKLFSFNGVLSLNDESFKETVKWFKSYERLSTLISVSCEYGRSRFFEEQRRVIENL